jgi:pimeloyl-ACP methyl ester carboxylesterase
MPREVSFDINGFHFAAQSWGEPEGLPVLALHGWLDNSASFFSLAPRLNNLHIIALDLAGHGQSSHRPGNAPYNIWEDVAEIFAVADHLGWEKFSLLGHSRGAIIAMLAAGTFPERIAQLALIEGLLPEPSSVEESPQQLARSINTLRLLSGKPLTCYPDLAAAIRAREQGMFPLGHAAATALTERGVCATEKGFHWSTDQRLFAPSSIKLTREQIQAFIMRISAPIKLILAQDGIPKRFASYQREVAAFPSVDVLNLSGGHHLHMEQEVDAVAEALNTFFHPSP